MSYWVVGGTYKNTDFDQLEAGQKLQRYGPFNSYEDATDIWIIVKKTHAPSAWVLGQDEV